MSNLMKLLDGNKTYLSSTLFALIAYAQARGWVDAELGALLLSLFGLGTVVALRSGMKKG